MSTTFSTLWNQTQWKNNPYHSFFLHSNSNARLIHNSSSAYHLSFPKTHKENYTSTCDSWHFSSTPQNDPVLGTVTGNYLPLHIDMVSQYIPFLSWWYHHLNRASACTTINPVCKLQLAWNVHWHYTPSGTFIQSQTLESTSPQQNPQNPTLRFTTPSLITSRTILMPIIQC